MCAIVGLSQPRGKAHCSCAFGHKETKCPVLQDPKQVMWEDPSVPLLGWVEDIWIGSGPAMARSKLGSQGVAPNWVGGQGFGHGQDSSCIFIPRTCGLELSLV